MTKSVLRAVLGRMQFTLHATRRTPHGASRLVQAMSAWLVNTRRAPSRHSRDARVHGHTTTPVHKLRTPPSPPPSLKSPKRLPALLYSALLRFFFVAGVQGQSGLHHLGLRLPRHARGRVELRTGQQQHNRGLRKSPSGEGNHRVRSRGMEIRWGIFCCYFFFAYLICSKSIRYSYYVRSRFGFRISNFDFDFDFDFFFFFCILT